MDIWGDCITKHYINGESLSDVHAYYQEQTGRTNKLSSFACNLSTKKHAKGKHNIVGIIGDCHMPFTLKGYLQFCYDTFKQYNVNQVMMIGDLVDHHALSRFQTEVDAMGGRSEYTLAIEMIKDMIVLFPSLKLTLGNHDNIPKRQAATLGLHSGFIKSFSEAYELPDTWIVDTEFLIDDVIYKHGLCSGGANGTLQHAINARHSIAIGHKHSCGGVRYNDNGYTRIFGLDCGCGINRKAYAFAYGKEMTSKPALGCGIVIDGVEAHFIPMSKKYIDM
jgi:predicted phosphodiesterase